MEIKVYKELDDVFEKSEKYRPVLDEFMSQRGYHYISKRGFRYYPFEQCYIQFVYESDNQTPIDIKNIAKYGLYRIVSVDEVDDIKQNGFIPKPRKTSEDKLLIEYGPRTYFFYDEYNAINYYKNNLKGKGSFAVFIIPIRDLKNDIIFYTDPLLSIRNAIYTTQYIPFDKNIKYSMLK